MLRSCQFEKRLHPTLDPISMSWSGIKGVVEMLFDSLYTPPLLLTVAYLSFHIYYSSTLN